MNGHHGHTVVIRLHTVQIRVQGDLVQEPGQGGVLRVLLQKAQNVGLQFLHVFDAAPALHVLFLLQRPDVAGLVQDFIVKFRQGQRPSGPAQAVDQIGELCQLACGGFQGGEQVRVADDLVERRPLLRRQLRHLVHSGRADAPCGRIDDAAEPQIVHGVIQHAQVGQHILDLRPVEELHAAYNFIGDGVALQGVFQCVGLGVHPVENGGVPEVPSPVDPHEDVPGHKVCLVPLVKIGLYRHHVAAAVVRPEGLALPALVVLDDGVGGIQNVLGGAVVLFQPNDPGVLVLLFKIQDILNVGPPETVDGLVIVTHHAEVPVSPGQQAGEEILQVVGVLILVHQHIPELFLVVVQHLRLRLQQRDGVVNDVVKVQGIGGAELLLIGGVDLGDPGIFPIVCGLRLFAEYLRPLVAVLGGADGGEDAADGEGLFVQILLLQNILDDPLGVIGIVDGEVLVKANAVNVPPQDADAGGVERGGPHIVGGGAKTGRQPLLQFSRRLIGEGDGDDLPWPGGVHGTEPVDPANLVTVWPIREVLQKAQILLRGPVGDLVAVAAPAIGQQVVDPLDQHRGLAAARPRQQQEGSLGGHGPLTLHGVQPGQIPGDHRFPGGHIPLFKISHTVLHSLCFLKLTSILRQKAATVNGGTADFSVSVL